MLSHAVWTEINSELRTSQLEEMSVTAALFPALTTSVGQQAPWQT
jgi:hypothetical protein